MLKPFKQLLLIRDVFNNRVVKNAQSIPVMDDGSRKVLKHLWELRITRIEPVIEDGVVRYRGLEGVLDPISGEKVIEELENLKIIDRLSTESRFSCPYCGSLALSVKLRCMSCSSPDIISGQIIEHLHCSHANFFESFLKDGRLICPKCNRTLQAIGVDYKKHGNAFKCSSCGAISPLVNETYVCQKCGHEVEKTSLTVSRISSYRVNLEKVEEMLFIPKSFKELERNLLADDIVLEYGRRVKGVSGIEHSFTLAATRNSKPSPSEPDILIELLYNKGEVVSEADIMRVYIKSMDVMIKNKLVAASPRLDAKGRKLMESIDVKVIEAKTLDELLEKLEDFVKNLLLYTKRTY